MPVKVSVIVPVYNPGDHIQALVESLLAQSLPAEQFEVVFVDDGSTDATPALLDRLADEHAHFHVVHQPNSGWPGKPRNVGLDRAVGDYVFFSDNDDWFGDEALERLHACALRTDADIVIGKMVGHGRGVPRELFRRNRDDATFANTPLQDSLTPHKLFRRALLVDHGLRFPEGRRRLEDHVFVMRAYFAANRIAVLADYDCYHHVRRPDESNAGFVAVEPVSYYGYVRETIDIVLANTQPGPVRDRLLRRFLRVEVLSRLEGRRFTARSREDRRALLEAARALVVETMPTSVDEGLPGRQRLLAGLLRAGDFDAVRRLAFWSVHHEGFAVDVRWADDGVQVSWSARVGRAGLVRRDGDVVRLVTPGHGRDRLTVDVTADLGRAKVDLVALDSSRGEVVLPGSRAVEVTPDGRLRARGDALAAFGPGVGRLPAGFWTLRLRARLLGWTVDSGPLSWPTHERPPAALVPKVGLVRPTRTKRGALALDVGGQARWLDPAFALATAVGVDADGALTVRVPAAARDVQTLPVVLGDERYDAVVTSGADGVSELHVAVDAPQAPAPFAVRIPGRSDPLPLGIVVSRNGAGTTAARPPGNAVRLHLRRLRTDATFTVAPIVARLDRLRRRVKRRSP